MPLQRALLLIFVATFVVVYYASAAVTKSPSDSHNKKTATVQRDVEDLIVNEGFLLTTIKQNQFNNQPTAQPRKPPSFSGPPSFKPHNASLNRTRRPLRRRKRVRPNEVTVPVTNLSRPPVRLPMKPLVKVAPRKVTNGTDQRMRRKAKAQNEEEGSDSREPVPLDPAFLEQFGGNAQISVLAPRGEGPTIASSENAPTHDEVEEPHIIEEEESVFPIAFEEVEVIEPEGGDFSAEYDQESELDENAPTQTFLPEDHLVSIF